MLSPKGAPVPGGRDAGARVEGGVNEGQSSGKGQRVEIWTDTYRLVGHVYVPRVMGGGTARLSDVINDPNRLFLPLTRVAMYRRGEDQVLVEHEFLLVSRASIDLIRPLD